MRLVWAAKPTKGQRHRQDGVTSRGTWSRTLADFIWLLGLYALPLIAIGAVLGAAVGLWPGGASVPEGAGDGVIFTAAPLGFFLLAGWLSFIVARVVEDLTHVVRKAWGRQSD